MGNISIHHGFWTNYDYNPVVGATLTLETRWGNYLIATLSSLVAWTGFAAWGIISYLFHQRMASRKNKDALDHQLQVLCRSSSGAFESLLEGAQLHIAWRKRALRVSIRILPLAVTGLVVWVVFITAGIFVAEVATKPYGDVVVLAKPLYCGDLIWAVGNETVISEAEFNRRKRPTMAVRDRKLISNVRSSRVYAQQWYMHGNYTIGAASQTSSNFKSSTLPYSQSDVECPWTIKTKCLGRNLTEGPALRMDTGLLDSHEHFGVNSPRQDRLQFRKLTVCGVLDTSAFIVKGDGNITDTSNFYGIELLDESTPDTTVVPPYGRVVHKILDTENSPYRIYRRNKYGNAPLMDDTMQGRLIPTFDRKDADQVFWAITNRGMYYSNPVLDPLYLSREPYSANSSGYISTLYTTSQPFGYLVCRDQYQLCNPNNGICSPLSGVYDLRHLPEESMGLNEHQKALALRYFWTMLYGGQTFANSASLITGLLAAEQAVTLAQPALPDNQWQLEVNLFFESALVNIQTMLLDWVSKPWHDPNQFEISHLNITGGEEAYRKTPGLHDAFEQMCANQLVRTSGLVQNFSMLATGLVTALCAVVIVLNMILPSIVTGLRNRRKSVGEVASMRELAREADDKYQLLRLALDGSQDCDWEGGAFGMPVTKSPVSIQPLVRDEGFTRYAWSGSQDSVFTNEDVEKGQILVEVASIHVDDPEDERPPTN